MSIVRRCSLCDLRLAPGELACPACHFERTQGLAARELERARLPIHRGQPGRKLGGVCSALAAELEFPPGLLRAAFLLGAFVFPLQITGSYLLLWVAIPHAAAPPGVPRASLLAAPLEWLGDLFDR